MFFCCGGGGGDVDVERRAATTTTDKDAATASLKAASEVLAAANLISDNFECLALLAEFLRAAGLFYALVSTFAIYIKLPTAMIQNSCCQKYNC